MRNWSLALGMLATIESGHAAAQVDPRKLCEFASIQKLSLIHNLTVISARTAAPPPALQAKFPYGMLVFIDVRLAGMTATYEFTCIAAPGKPVGTQSLGIVK